MSFRRCVGQVCVALVVAVSTVQAHPLLAQGVQGVPAPVVRCTPVRERTQDVGCWILADAPIGPLTKPLAYWVVREYPTRAIAEAARGPRATVLESLGKVWLFTIEEERSRDSGKTPIIEIGPLAVVPGESYSTQYMEAIFTPGMTAAAHRHSGPEAWYTVTGETCLESSDGRVQVGRAGGDPVIVPAGHSMHLTATGTETRRSLVLILHPSALPPSTLVHDWVPKGRCLEVGRVP